MRTRWESVWPADGVLLRGRRLVPADCAEPGRSRGESMDEGRGGDVMNEPGDARFRAASAASADMREAGHRQKLAAAGGYEGGRG